MSKLTSEEALNQIAKDISVIHGLVSSADNRWDHTRAIGAQK